MQEPTFEELTVRHYKYGCSAGFNLVRRTNGAQFGFNDNSYVAFILENEDRDGYAERQSGLKCILKAQ